jgi:hypothetical protein
MADHYDSTVETEKMTESDSDKSSVESIPGPTTTTELDLEKVGSRHTQRTTRSARSGHPPQTAQDWDGDDDPGIQLYPPHILQTKALTIMAIDNPVNWPLASKIYHVLVPALQCFTMYAVAGSRCVCKRLIWK